MKINILDAAIRSRSGHHFDYALKLLKHFAQAGHDVHIYGFSGMDDAAAEAFEACGAVTKLFRAFQFNPSYEYDWYAGQLVQYHRESAIIVEDLRSVRTADIWIWLTLNPQQLDACATCGVDAPMVGCVYWDPGVESRSIEAMLWRTALVSARRTGLRFTLASVEPELRHRFMPIVANRRFAVVPHPVEGPPIPEPKTALKRIGFFGHQRADKGLTFLKPLLDRLVADGFAITFQNSNPDSQAPDVPGIDLLEYVDDFAVPIGNCDLVVLSYDVETYQARGSGVLAQCLAVGIPVVGPVGTLPGRTIEQYQVGPLFIANQPGPIYQAIKAAERSYAAFAANAFRVARQFSKRHGVAKFASALLAQAEKGGSGA